MYYELMFLGFFIFGLFSQQKYNNSAKLSLFVR